MRRDRIVQLICALLGALASLIVVIDFCSRASPPLREPSAPAPLATLIPAPEVSLPPAPPPESQDEISETVYRTPSGKRYHRATCGHVKGKGIELSLAEAKERGLTPCRVCNPPPLP